MKHIFFIAISCLFALNISAQSENEVRLSADYDASLDCSQSMGGNGGIRVLSPYDDLIVMVTSGNMAGEMIQRTRNVSGDYEYIVPINVGKYQEAHFIFTRRGRTMKAEFSEKRLRPDYLLGYRVKSVDNPIRLSYQPSVGDMYPSESEGLVEISTAFKKLNIHVPTALPFEIKEGKQENDSSINVYKIIVPVAKIKELQEKCESKSEEYEALDKALIASDNGDDSRWEELDKMEAEVMELQAAVASVQQIDLDAPESNSLSIDISQMGPRSKMVVAVVPLVRIDTVSVFKNPYDLYMAQAQDAYDKRNYATAKNLYIQAQQVDGISSLQATTAQECSNTMDGLSNKLQTVKGCVRTWKKIQEGGSVKRHVAEECLELAINTLQQLYDSTHDEFYASRIRSFSKRLSEFPVVIEGKFRVKKYDEGIMHISSLNQCNIYGCTSKKDKVGTLIGHVENDGSFHVQFERGEYTRLLLKPLPGSPLKVNTKLKLKKEGRCSMTLTKDLEPK